MQSSSGGGASALSEAIIRKGGAVFGACYSPDFRSAEFACAETLADLPKLKGSKYIPTNKRVLINGEYVSLWQAVAGKLTEGRPVLFTGLGCDVAGLKSYMAANSIGIRNLYTADLICYGPVPLAVHKQFIDSLERRYNSRIKSFTARHKPKGWTPPYVLAEFEDGRKFCEPLYETDYGVAFGGYAREACYGCRFKDAGHQADITLGDYWGLTRRDSGVWNPDGVSVFIVRTERGEELLRMIDTEDFALSPADVKFVVEHNKMYYMCRDKPGDYGKFFADLKALGLHRAVVSRTGRLRYYARRVKNRVKKLIPRPVKRIIKAILGR